MVGLAPLAIAEACCRSGEGEGEAMRSAEHAARVMASPKAAPMRRWDIGNAPGEGDL